MNRPVTIKHLTIAVVLTVSAVFGGGVMAVRRMDCQLRAMNSTVEQISTDVEETKGMADSANTNTQELTQRFHLDTH